MLGINARVEETKQKLVEVINDAQMPACVLDYMLTELLNNVRMRRADDIQKERDMYAKEQESTPKKDK